MFSIEVEEENQIQFNYFYTQFTKKYNERVINFSKNKISNSEGAFEIFFPVTKKEQLEIKKKVLYEICEDYVNLSNSSINIYPTNVLEFVCLILDSIEENPYKNSFLMSLQFIYQDIFMSLGHDYIELWSTTTDDNDTYMEVWLNVKNQINKFNSNNIELIEQDKIITKILKMELDGNIGPIDKVKIRHIVF